MDSRWFSHMVSNDGTTNEDVKQMLVARFGPAKRVSQDNKDMDAWETPYGFNIFDCGLGMMWFYTYNKNIGYCDAGEGVILSGDLAIVLKKLENDPELLKRKPDSIKQLENATGQTAHRKDNHFGSWALYKDELWSLFNNPFSISGGYTDGENNFEIWFIKVEEEPREYQTVQQIIDTMKKLAYI